MENLELHVIFEGKVQGVGFRATVRSIALEINVLGTICNLQDGTVELYAQAPKETLEQLLDSIAKQFPASSCSLLSYSKTTKSFFSFCITS